MLYKVCSTNIRNKQNKHANLNERLALEQCLKNGRFRALLRPLERRVEWLELFSKSWARWVGLLSRLAEFERFWREWDLLGQHTHCFWQRFRFWTRDGSKFVIHKVHRVCVLHTSTLIFLKWSTSVWFGLVGYRWGTACWVSGVDEVCVCVEFGRQRTVESWYLSGRTVPLW